MEGVTFVFKSERNWTRIYDMLYNTPAHFTSYGYLAITVWDDSWIEEVRAACKKSRIAFKEE
jgi:hypothetical protein